MAAGQLVGRDDAVAFLDARHHFELDGIDVAHRAHAAEHRVHHPGGAMDDEAHRHQPVDDVLGLRLFGAFLHDYEHGVYGLDLSFQYSEMAGMDVLPNVPQRPNPDISEAHQIPVILQSQRTLRFMHHQFGKRTMHGGSQNLRVVLHHDAVMEHGYESRYIDLAVLNRGALYTMSYCCHSPGGRHALTSGGDWP